MRQLGLQAINPGILENAEQLSFVKREGKELDNHPY